MDLTAWNLMGQLKRTSGTVWQFHIFGKDVIHGTAYLYQATPVALFQFEYLGKSEKTDLLLAEWFKLHESKVLKISPGSILLVKF